MILDLLTAAALHSTLLGLAVWILLKIFLVKRAGVRMTVWTVALLVSVATPALMPWMKIAIPIPEPAKSSVRAVAALPAKTDPMIDELQLSTFPSKVVNARAKSGEWQVWAIAVYIAGAGVMLIRIFRGLLLACRLVRAAPRLPDPWTGGLKIKVSKVMRSPATFGSTILLPADYGTWSEEKRRAVLLHEGSHVANHDFYVLLLASFYRAAFWFNPFAWWLSANLSDLAEMVADDAAARGLSDRHRYAEILTDLTRYPNRLPAGLAMARPGAVEWRIRRLETASFAPGALGRGERTALVTALIPIAVLSAATLTWTEAPPSGPDAASPTGLVSSDAERAYAIKAAFARRTAAAPDRFLRQTPLPGGEIALRQVLVSLCCGAPNYTRISAELSGKLGPPNSALHVVLARFGAPKALLFKGVGPGGYDIYDVRFERGSAEARIDLAPDRTLEDLNLRPDGDGTLGGVVSCARATSLAAPHDLVPIRLAIANRSGVAMDLYSFDDLERTQRHTALPDGESIHLTTDVEQPLMVSDPSGRCLDIILPGRATRSNVIGPKGVLISFRRTAYPGGAEVLRQYLDGVRRGAPAYDRMTPEAAATAQGFEMRRRVILDRFGVLEGLWFQGVSDTGEDIYRARFTNGWAEWRVAFDDGGRVSSISLGPAF